MVKTNNSIFSKSISLVLAVFMLIQLLPVPGFAEEIVPENTETTENAQEFSELEKDTEENAVEPIVYETEQTSLGTYYKVTFYADDEIVETRYYETSGEPAGEMPVAPEKEGFQFEGWKLADEDQIFSPDETVTASMNLYAVYAEREEPDPFKHLFSDVELDGQAYHVQVDYDDSAEIPENAVLSVKQVNAEDYFAEMAELLNWDESDYVLYTTFLDISILDENGIEIEPKAAVTVTVDLIDTEQIMESVQVVHFAEDGAQEISCDTTENAAVVFETESFSVFGIGNALHPILTEETSEANITILTSASKDAAEIQEKEIQNEIEGIEIVKSFEITKNDLNSSDDLKLWVKTELNTDAALSEHESVALYNISEDTLNDVIVEQVSKESAIQALNSEISGFAIVKDSGFRHFSVQFQPDQDDDQRVVTIDGMMPKDVLTSVSDVTESYPDISNIQVVPSEPIVLKSDLLKQSLQKQSLNVVSPQSVSGIQTVEPAADEPEIEQAAKPGDKVTLAAYEILVNEGEADYTPDENNPVSVSIQDERIVKNRHVQLWNIDENGNAEEVDDFDLKNGSISFTAKAFHVYAVTTIIEKTITASDGSTYRIVVEYDESADLPDNIDLEVIEIIDEDESYQDYYEHAVETLDLRKVYYSKMFDISIVDADDPSIHYQPKDIVDVRIELLDHEGKDDSEISVVHFGEETELMEVDREGSVLSFTSGSFSVYAIVDGPAPYTPSEIRSATTIAELTSETAQDGFLLSVSRGTQSEYYFMGTVSSEGCLTETTSVSSAAIWFLEPVEGQTNTFYIYTMMNGSAKYIKNISGGNKLELSDSGTPLVFSQAQGGRFNVKMTTEGKWLQHSNGGGGIRFWTDIKNAGNSRIKCTYFNSFMMPVDPYGLDGTTAVLMSAYDGISGFGMMAEQATEKTLEGVQMTIRVNPLDRDETLYIARDSEISEWAFHSIREDLYTVSTTVNGATKYLNFTNDALTLVDEENASEIQVVPGINGHAGQIRLSCGGKSISFAETTKFHLENDNASQSAQYLNFARRSDMDQDDFVSYSAQKVSISDPSITNGSRVVIYTRAWDDVSKKYVFYAVDHDGTLVPCYESGDVIQWVGTRLNTMLWNFTEYYWEGTTESNDYYELKNPYSGKFIAPQIMDAQILSDEPIGINLNGRKYGDYYSSIIAWDDAYYSYAGLKVQNGKIVSCPFAEALDFYFAIMQDLPAGHELTTVPTIDHTQYGITMKLIDFDGNTGMNSFLGSSSYTPSAPTSGLLSTNLGSDGYPTAAGGSLGSMFAGAFDVNHLFITSTYNGSGYYEFDSTQNFASIGDDNNFVVYKELGTTDVSSKPSLKHGEFFPFDDLDRNLLASINDKNLYSATLEPLQDNDPRKYEQLYLVPTPNYHFGMEIGASFIQTPNGQDAWGHDVIYEFTGDDDFWLYVDGELVIDLGGIHSALPGSVNYCTGDVYVNGIHTTLYDVFKSNYENRGMSAAEISTKLNSIFDRKTNSAGNTYYTFKDYSPHSMKIFFMERGAGASNLHMRFNLSSVKPGQVILNKQISGSVDDDYKLAEYGYQIYYKVEGAEEFQLLSDKDDSHHINVTYQNTNVPVKYLSTFTPAGSSLEYHNVFFLTPQQTVLISVPSDTISYKIVECGVNAQVYDHVYVNDVEIEKTETDDPTRVDYESEETTVAEKPRAVFTNHVSANAKRTLTITKKLYDIENNLITDDPTGFNFRLYLGNENDTTLKTASLQNYCVKDAHDNYCYWDPIGKTFVSYGISDYDQLTDAQKQRATFQTSFNGAISKIPAEYKVEVRDLLVGSKFMVEERVNEVPAGYSFIEYVRDGSSYIANGESINAGTVRQNESPAIEIHNRRGFGLTIKKQWSDDNFMEYHDDIYFAVYVNGNLLTDSVRALKFPNKSVYYYWDELDQNASSLSDYSIFEVDLEGPVSVDPNTGAVSGYTNLTKINEGNIISIVAKAEQEDTPRSFDYTATYAVGQIGGTANNVRTDTVTNSRHGIRLLKKTWSGNPLAGAVFTLTDASNNMVGSGRYTSQADGTIDIAYVNVDTVYTLTEISTPAGYHGLSEPIKFKLNSSNSTVEVTSGEEGYYTVVQETANEMASITVKNRPVSLRAIKQGIKVDGSTELLSNATFALYREVTVDGITRIDFTPVAGYESLVSQSISGLIPQITQSLPKGAYYIKELEAAEGYMEIEDPIRFEIDDLWNVRIDSSEDAELSEEIRPNGEYAYTIIVKNHIAEAELTISKTVGGDIGDRRKNFTFTLVSVEDENANKEYSWRKTTADHTVTSGKIKAGETFTLGHGDMITIVLPINKEIEISEENEYYETSWTFNSEEAVNDNTATVTITENSTLQVVNILNAVSPTNVQIHLAPYAILFSIGILYAIIMFSKKRFMSC